MTAFFIFLLWFWGRVAGGVFLLGVCRWVGGLLSVLFGREILMRWKEYFNALEVSTRDSAGICMGIHRDEDYGNTLDIRDVEVPETSV